MVRTGDLCLRLIRKAGLIPRVSLTLDEETCQTIRKILIVRVAYIGDAIMTIPVIKPLKKAFPNAQIHLLTSKAAAQLLESDPDLDDIIPINPHWFYRETPRTAVRRVVKRITDEKYDLGIDFRADIRNIYHFLFKPRIHHRLSYTSGGAGHF